MGRLLPARRLRHPHLAGGGLGLAATRAFDIARQPIDLWPAAGLVRPTIPLVPSAQTVVLPCLCPRLPPFPMPCFRAGLDGGCCCRPRRCRRAPTSGSSGSEALHPAVAAQLVRRGAERPAEGQPVFLSRCQRSAGRPQGARRDSRCRSAVQAKRARRCFRKRGLNRREGGALRQCRDAVRPQGCSASLSERGATGREAGAIAFGRRGGPAREPAPRTGREPQGCLPVLA